MTTTPVAFGSVQNAPATPVHFYSSITARCWCGSTIKLRTDGYWTHGTRVGIYCRENR